MSSQNYQSQYHNDAELAVPRSNEPNNWNRSYDTLTSIDRRSSSPLYDSQGNRLPHTPSSFGTGLNSSRSGDTLTDTSRGVQLFETIAPDATPVQRKHASLCPSTARSGVASPATLNAGIATSSINRGQMGTVRRMSMRGKKPTRIIKKRIVNKTDAKSYFSSERTMYAWMYLGTIILGISLTIYRYINVNQNLTMIIGQTGTLLSGLSLVIFYYAAIHFFWRRCALNRGCEAQAFDDKLGPILVVALICIGLTVNMFLIWINPIAGLQVKLRFGSFATPHPAGEYTLWNGTRVTLG